MLERPPRDDLRVQRWLGRILWRLVLIGGAGVVWILVHAKIYEKRLPSTLGKWLVIIAALGVMNAIADLLERYFQRAVDLDGPPFVSVAPRRRKRR